MCGIVFGWKEEHAMHGTARHWNGKYSTLVLAIRFLCSAFVLRATWRKQIEDSLSLFHFVNAFMFHIEQLPSRSLCASPRLHHCNHHHRCVAMLIWVCVCVRASVFVLHSRRYTFVVIRRCYITTVAIICRVCWHPVPLHLTLLMEAAGQWLQTRRHSLGIRREHLAISFSRLA